MVNDSWLRVQGSGAMPLGSWLKAHGQEKIWCEGPGLGGRGTNIFLAMSHEPWAMKHE